MPRLAATTRRNSSDLSSGRRLAVADRQRDDPQPERSEHRVVDRPIGLSPQVHDRRDPGRRQRPVSLQGRRRRAAPHLGVDRGEVGDIAYGCGGRRRRRAGEVLEQERRDEDRQVPDDHEQHEPDDGAPCPDERSLVSPPRARGGGSWTDHEGRCSDVPSLPTPPRRGSAGQLRALPLERPTASSGENADELVR